MFYLSSTLDDDDSGVVEISEAVPLFHSNQIGLLPFLEIAPIQEPLFPLSDAANVELIVVDNLLASDVDVASSVSKIFPSSLTYPNENSRKMSSGGGTSIFVIKWINFFTLVKCFSSISL